VFQLALQVRWGDMDAFNHVNNAQYLRYLEEARVRWLESLPGVSLRDRIAPVLAASNVNYRTPIGWPSEIVVELFLERIGTKSITVSHRMLSGSDESVLYSDGNVVMVWVDSQTGTSVPLPEALRAALA
jgi:acyl-CoA thioester hydrolase